MKMYFCGVALTLLAITNVFAQKAPIKFGDVPMEDLKMTSYAPDTSAAAVVLADYGEARISVTSTVTMNFERHIRIKILKKEGLDFANAEVLLYHVGSGEEKVAQLKAATYNLEAGKIVENKMSKDGVFKEKFNKYFDRQKFTLPNVKVGSVIEYSYTVISEFYTNFPNWRFQTSIPTRLSEYYAFIPEFFHYQKYLQGYVPITNYEVTPKPTPSYEAQVHHWICKDVPAFKKEPYMTSEDDYVSKINFALARVNFPGQLSQEIMTSWASLNKGLVEDSDFMGVINGSGFLKKNAEEVTAGITEPVDKIRAIHSYVKNNIEWTGEKEMYPGNLKKVLETKKGDAADINFVLGSMLEKAGFAVDMVLLSTRDHGFVRQEFPMRKQFNYVICSVKLNDKTFLLDATEPFLPMELLPDRCLNGQGMVVSKLNHGWVNLETKAKSKTVITADLQRKSELSPRWIRCPRSAKGCCRQRRREIQKRALHWKIMGIERM